MQNLKQKRGQGLVEYVILVTVMGIALVATIKLLGTTTQAKFATATAKVAGL